MTEESYCVSCKRQISNRGGTATFLCPGCAKTLIVRCKDCRQIAAKYTCPECGFEGPN